VGEVVTSEVVMGDVVNGASLVAEIPSVCILACKMDLDELESDDHAVQMYA
jgi:hypothetical protein